MRVVNFAHGEFLMLGMYAAFWAFTLLHTDPYLTLALAVPLFLALGWGSYALIMRPVVNTSHNVQVFTTVGLSIVLQNLALVLWTGDARFVRTSYYASVISFGGAVLNLAQAVAFILAMAATAARRWTTASR